MRSREPVATVLLLAGVSLLGACLSRPYPERERFVLHAERPGLPAVSAPPPAASPGRVEGEVLRVSRVRVSPLFERRGFVYRTDENRFEEDFFHGFFLPPGRIVQRETHSWLATSGLFPTVLRGGDPGSADWVLDAKVTELFGDRRGEPLAVMSIEFSLLDDREGKLELVAHQAYREAIPVERGDPKAFQAGWREALSRILSDLETDLGRELPALRAAPEDATG